MDNFEYIPNASVVRSARAFISSICRCYGTDRGMGIWDHIRTGLGDDIAGDIFMGMLIGSGINVQVSSAGNNFINSIKEVRVFTGWGLKEAKDFVEAVRDNGPRTLEITDENQPRLEAFTKNMIANGCIID